MYINARGFAGPGELQIALRAKYIHGRDNRSCHRDKLYLPFSEGWGWISPRLYAHCASIYIYIYIRRARKNHFRSFSLQTTNFNVRLTCESLLQLAPSCACKIKTNKKITTHDAYIDYKKFSLFFFVDATKK